MTLAEGTSAADGSFVWRAPGYNSKRQYTLRRIVVDKGVDLAAFDATRPPEGYADDQWSKSRETWLQWTVEMLQGRGAPPRVLAHLFTDRPVYRPGEEVHIKGYLRTRADGHLTPSEAKAGWWCRDRATSPGATR